MVLHFVKGNLLSADTEALVNTVNTVGVMGKGIALQFKQAFPDNFKEYKKACNKGMVSPGKMFIYENHSLSNPKYIINFPTKRHWKSMSKMQDIKDGLKAFREDLINLNIKSVSLPPLGCGNGGLEWSEVKPLITSSLEDLHDVDIYIYEPTGSPEPEKIPIRTNKPKMTKARALLILLMEQYTVPGYKLSLLEIQKLAYLLQEVGEPLKLNYVKYTYGPYAENLNHVLIRLDGHFIRGYGDRNRHSQISLSADAPTLARKFIENDEESIKRLQKVKELISGFETPYGMELISSVHWANKHGHIPLNQPSKIVEFVQQWNERKKLIFKESHILKTINHLKSSI
ncbi:O-acetyl-ADP-ribose deacetylase (regulator of RNase III) [Cytobacillus firmus]|uniref:O-acetyl-ADP-ribose deacetylase (Regulator of RNase III) n=2 Tax=Cytobacillus TaxID=2675230 RepID=A0A366JHP9_CYTFI|nr:MULTISPECIES: macro domain-containing protein [Cytobacillus]RBP85979.1 O-acetyl-ADP-ribose deacetylase (regulator of RNase III) [Cytobacillus firmus]TDX35083.1 O-acetyl-ADP-ribose deacetylase (regulator of RNase III) [Cytobacillus oceanisediminis]